MKYSDSMSELLGILQSINYDMVINDLEIASLKKWITANNSNHDPRFQEIISKLNIILKDGIITEKEKKDIVKITDQYHEVGTSLNDAKELIGIMEGIISDNHVNSAEVNKLKIWLNNNIQLCGNYFYDRLTLLVQEIMNDNILDQDEQQKLKNLLISLLNDNGINCRIKMLKEKVKKGQIIGNQLIELNDNTVISKIHDEAMNQLNILLNKRYSVYDVDSEIIYISLSLIALFKYDGNYYNHVEDTYSELYQKYTSQKIEGQIRNVISIYKNNTKDEYRRIISSVIKTSIVPKYYLPSFFEFIYDIYRLNFEYDIDKKDLNEEFEFVYDGIKKDLNLENDSLDLKVTNKTYNLIVTTKDLILESDNTAELIVLSINVLKIIDNYYWPKSELNIENKYFEYGFSNWKQNKIKAIPNNKPVSKEFKSRWEPKFKLVGNKIYLKMPSHKIKNYYDYEKLSIEITNGDSLLYINDSPEIYNIIGGYRVENGDVLIDNPLGCLSYKLICGDDIIYDSGENLYRKYIFFDSSGNELKNNSDYGGKAFLCSQEKHDNISLVSVCDNYVIGFKEVKIGDYFKIDEEIFNFATKIKPGILGNEQKGKCKILNEEMPIYEDVDGIDFETESEVDKLAIIINEKRYHLTEFDIDIKKRGIYNNILVKLNLKNEKYEIAIEENIDGSYHLIKKFCFVVDNQFGFKIEQINLDEYYISIKYLDKMYYKTINFDCDDINLIDFENISFIIQLNIPLFKLDNTRWEKIVENYVWIKDINMYSNLRLNGFEFTEVYVNDENDKLLMSLSPTTKMYYFDLPIGSLKSYESCHKYVTLNFYNNDKKILFLKCYCQCCINNNQTYFWYDEKKEEYKSVISYFGKGNINIKVIDRFGKSLYESKIDNGEEICLKNLKSFEEYKLQVIDKKVGFVLEGDNIIYERNIKYYSMKDFIGRYFQILSVEFDQSIEGILTRKSRKLYNTYVEIIKRVDDYEFIGNIYVYKGERKNLDMINPVEIEFTSDINDGKVEASITKDGDGLFNDFEHHTILNVIESKTAIDIFSYIVSVEGKK